MSLLLGPPLRDEVAAFFEPRAAEVDAGTRDVREGIAFAQRRILAEHGQAPDRDLAVVAATIGTIAWSDLASAFSLWCHRMVIEYLSLAPAGSPLRTTVLPDVVEARVVGSTGLASAMAHHVSGTPLPIEARRSGAERILTGKVRWASNLFAPDYVLVTAARDVQTGAVIVALPGAAHGLRIDPYPEVLALGSTASSSLVVDGVRVADDQVVSGDFPAFIRRIRPVFLVLQSAFCWGLARRALDESAVVLQRDDDVLRPEFSGLAAEADRAGAAIRAAAAAGGASNVRALVRLRLDVARLALAAVALEATVAGSRGYLRSSPTARRIREAAFLPIQAPTELQLRAELARAEPEARVLASAPR